MAKEMKLREIHYDWEGPPVVYQKGGRRAEQMECRDDSPHKHKRSPRVHRPKKRRSAKERRAAPSGKHHPRSMKSVVVKVTDPEQEGKEEGEISEDLDESVPLLVQIPGLFGDEVQEDDI